MRRWLALAAAMLLLALAACTDDAPDPEPTPEDDGEDEPVEPPAQGLRVGVVLPARDAAAADEVAAVEPGLDALVDAFDSEVAEVRAVVPDAGAFVPDVATLLVSDGYDLVCVFGRDAGSVVLELAERHAATDFCAAPVVPAGDLPPNVVMVDVALPELGHVVGVAMAVLADGDPVALLGVGNRAGGEAFRNGLRAGVGATPLREGRGELEDLSAEIEAARDDDVVVIAVDAGPQAAELVADMEGVALLAPAPLLSEEDPGALRWRVRWEVVLEAVLAHHLDDDDEELPEVLGLAEEVFAVDHGPQAGTAVAEVIGQIMGQLERGDRDPLQAADQDDEEDDDEDGEDDDGDADDADD